MTPARETHPRLRVAPRAQRADHRWNWRTSPSVIRCKFFVASELRPIPPIGLANEENRREPKHSRILGEQILSSTDAFIRTE